MKFIKLQFFLALMIILLCACQQNDEPIPVNDSTDHYLWIGDDNLKAGPLDMQVLLMLELSGYPTYLEMQNWIDPNNTLDSSPDMEGLHKQMLEHNSDRIFIQAFGVQRSFTADQYLQNAKIWIGEIRDENRQVVLFYPWFSEVDDEATIARLDAFVLEAAWSENLILVPVGPAWQSVKTVHPEIKLYADDGIHPSPEGVYLSACVFYSTITGLSPEGNPVRTSIGYDKPEKIVTLDSGIAAILQESAWETIQDYLQKGEFKVLLEQESK